MASSRKSSRSSAVAGDLAARVAAQLREIVKLSDRLAIGLSGGVDSVVLLDCLRRAARRLGFRLCALHVNHQLSPNAARWSAFCGRLCRAGGIPFRSVKVTVRRGDSLEAAARAARYAEFGRLPCDYVVLAHHRDDQSETLLLQLLRGAGVKGLAAMPPVRKAKEDSSPVTRHSSPSILRPLLDTTREEILAYARKRRLKWVEDESNQDTSFQRNYLRHEVLPAIARRFPAYRSTLARAARHLADAAEMLDALAVIDGAAHIAGETLAAGGLRRLSPARARNLLRYFLASRGVAAPNAERLDEGLRQVVSARRDSQSVIELGSATLRRFADRLHVVPKAGHLRQDYEKRWRGERELAVPELGGVLVMARGKGDGISGARLRAGPVTVRVRHGGERLQPNCRRPRRSLKNLLQETAVPPWVRERLLLVFCGADLVWAEGIGVDCRYQAARHEPALRPAWKPFA